MKIDHPSTNQIRLYRAAHDWIVMRDPARTNGAFLWVAERTTRGTVELKGFDSKRAALAWCESAQ